MYLVYDQTFDDYVTLIFYHFFVLQAPDYGVSFPMKWPPLGTVMNVCMDYHHRHRDDYQNDRYHYHRIRFYKFELNLKKKLKSDFKKTNRKQYIQFSFISNSKR